MKVLVVWTSPDDTPKFYVVDGPVPLIFHNDFIGIGSDQDKTINDFFFDDKGKPLHTELDPLTIPEGHFDAVIITGIV